ncbi:MAG: hypothetical protein CMO80_00255 [Verrucomicrobiales bacterium]|nr:hypothetical protein [Verrucomicrobiales bacterium]|tara:strand:+ start:4581 stop:5132 length:552 start_codon:yes stop_codon:yes gene_type:complete
MPQFITTKHGERIGAERLKTGDGPALQAFNASLSDDVRARFLPHAYDDETVARMIARAEADDDRAYVLRVNDAIVGYFFLWNFMQPVPLLGIGLADEFQGKSLGPQMMKVLIDDAKDAGRDGIELTTVPENEAAFKLYRIMGFEHLGEVENIAGDGRKVIERLMFLPLKPGAEPSGHSPKPPE